jgi:hypothetical protein
MFASSSVHEVHSSAYTGYRLSYLPGSTYRLVSGFGHPEGFAQDCARLDCVPDPTARNRFSFGWMWRSGEPVTATNVGTQPLVVIYVTWRYSTKMRFDVDRAVRRSVTPGCDFEDDNNLHFVCLCHEPTPAIRGSICARIL